MNIYKPILCYFAIWLLLPCLALLSGTGDNAVAAPLTVHSPVHATIPAALKTTPQANIASSAAKYPFEPESGGFITGQYLIDYQDQTQIFDSPKSGRWPGSAASNLPAARGAQHPETYTAQEKPGSKDSLKQTLRDDPAPENYTTAGDVPGQAVPLKIIIPLSVGTNPSAQAAKPVQPVQTGQNQAARPANPAQLNNSEKSASAGGSGSAPFDIYKPVTIAPDKPAASTPVVTESDLKSGTGMSSDDFYSRFGQGPTPSGETPAASEQAVATRPSPANISSSGASKPPVPNGPASQAVQAGQAGQTGQASQSGRQQSLDIPPIGRVIAPIIASAPPEVQDDGPEASPFDAVADLDVSDAKKTPTERFGTAIPSFTAEQAEAGSKSAAGSSTGNNELASSGQPNTTNSGLIYIPPPNLTPGGRKGPVGQMGQ